MQWLWRCFVCGVRGFLHDRARLRVLVLGDSHVRVFEHWLFLLKLPKISFDVVYVPGGTALGICNHRSKTQARVRFEEAVAAQKHGLVLVNLGEVDTAYTMWRRAEINGQDPYLILDRAVKNYCSFLATLQAEDRPLVVLSATLPTLPDQGLNEDDSVRVRGTVKVSQLDRTGATLAFNKRIKAFCNQRSIPYLSGDVDALGPNGLVRRDWVNSKHIDHHYARLPYARWLIFQLKKYMHPSGIIVE